MTVGVFSPAATGFFTSKESQVIPGLEIETVVFHLLHFSFPLQNRSWKCCQGPAEAFSAIAISDLKVLGYTAGPGMQIFKQIPSEGKYFPFEGQRDGEKCSYQYQAG